MSMLVNYQALLDHLNPTCFRALEGSAELAMGRNHAEVEIPHFLLKLMEDAASDITHILRGLGVAVTPLLSELQGILERTPRATGRPDVSPYIGYWIQDAWLLGSLEYGAPGVRSGFLLAVLLRGTERYRSRLPGFVERLTAIDAKVLLGRMSELTKHSAEAAFKPVAASGSAATVRGDKESALSKFTEDLTARARAGQIDPVLGRDRELAQVIMTLGRRRKNNPLIVGEAGVGKTAVVEALALRIAAVQVPKELRDVELRSLDLGLLQAGAGVRGEFEARLTAVIKEVQSSPRPIILFIDEAHTLIGSGNQAGGSDAANLLKPALARGTLRTIAATTWSEYKKYFETDAALSRRFHLVKVDQPGRETAIDMLRGLAARMSHEQQVCIQDAGVIAAVELSSRYVSGRLLPDKAVDLLDSCVGRVKQALDEVPPELAGAERELEALQRERDARGSDLQLQGVHLQADETLTELEQSITLVQTKRLELQDRWQKECAAAREVLELRAKLKEGAAAADPVLAQQLQRALARRVEEFGAIPLVPIEVDAGLVATVVAEWTGIPVGNMLREELKTLQELQPLLARRIRGQPEALRTIAARLQAAQAGTNDPREPRGVFLLVGPSGTGKTETALAVAEQLFGGEQFAISINMTEFQEKHTISRLIGSPPGYVGFREGGVLTEAVRQRPYSVVLLDEIEKADLNVLNLFHQVFDKGVLADGEGRAIDFRNTVLFLTSNLASDLTMKLAQEAAQPLSASEIARHIRPVLQQHLKPALLNRMTVVPYFPLSHEVLRDIVQMKLAQLAERLNDRYAVSLVVDDDVIDVLIRAATDDPEAGARNVNHIIREHLQPLVTGCILNCLVNGRLPPALQVQRGTDARFQVCASWETPAAAAAVADVAASV